MFTRPSFALAAGILFTLAVTASTVIAPLPVLFEAWAPLDIGTERLRTVWYVDDSGECGEPATESWQIIARQPDASARFQALSREAVHPAGVLMAAAGIWTTDSTSGAAAIAALRPSAPESVLVRVGDHSTWRAFDTVAASVVSGRLSKTYATKQHRVAC